MDKSNVWTFAAAAAWPAAILIFAACFRTEVASLIRSMVARLRSGAGLKVGALELPPLIFTPAGSVVYDIEDDDGIREHERSAIYDQARRIVLVHKIYRSPDEQQLFDIEVFLLAHKEGSLREVVDVRYFFGSFWKNKIFVAKTRHNGFAIRISAYGCTLCTAKVKFTDGKTITLNRYLDFEMGAQAPLIEERRDKDAKP